MRRWYAPLAAGAAIVALASSLLYAQVTGLFPTAINGQESWEVAVGNPAGPGEYITANMIRGGTPQAIFSAVSGNLTIGAASGNFTVTGTPSPTVLNLSGGNILVTAQPSVATWTWPPNPILDGAIVGVCNVSGSAFATNAQTPAANTNQTMNTTAAFTTLAAGSCVRYQWNQSQATWYRVQ